MREDLQRRMSVNAGSSPILEIEGPDHPFSVIFASFNSEKAWSQEARRERAGAPALGDLVLIRCARYRVQNLGGFQHPYGIYVTVWRATEIWYIRLLNSTYLHHYTNPWVLQRPCACTSHIV